MGLIDRGKVMSDYLENLGRADSYKAKYEALVKAVDNAPAIDAKPVRHGRWIEVEDRIGEVYYTCSNCGEDWYIPDGTPAENNMHYCPRCGAKMDLEVEHD